MQQKKSIYILLPVVFLIWGIIIYKVLNPASNGENKPVASHHVATTTTVTPIEDTFALINNYRDPFLSHIKLSEPHPASTIQTKPAAPPKPKPDPVVVQWPSLSYLGMVKNSQSNKQLGMLMVNNQNMVVKQGELIGELKIISLFKDSIVIKLNKETRCIKK